MTQEEIIQEMRNGKFARWEYFKDDEWMTISKGKILFEDGVRMPIHEFFERSKEGFSVVDVPTFEKDGKRYVISRDFNIHVGDMVLFSDPWPMKEKTRLEICNQINREPNGYTSYQYLVMVEDIQCVSNIRYQKHSCQKLMEV